MGNLGVLILATVICTGQPLDFKLAELNESLEYVEEVEEPQVFEYDIPIDKDLQEYTYNLCVEYRIPYELIIAVIKCESTFDPKCVGNGDYGIMQLNWHFHKKTFYEAGHTDVFNPYQNIAYGIDYLAGFYHSYNKDEHAALMCYNMGEKRYRELAAEGITSSEYSRNVMAYKDELIKYRYENLK
jgi:soluble lytic murein transglycosylase-like protein